MNQKLGMTGSIITGMSVLCFAIFMLIGFDFGSYLVCMFLAIGYLIMAAAFQSECNAENRALGNIGLTFSGIYTGIVLLVYFAQTTSVRLEPLSSTALQLLDYKKFGLFFSYDLLGYGIMALSTLFIGLAITASNNRDTALKRLMCLHGVFFISCFITPMLGIFSPDMTRADWIGVLVLEVWCAYFLPITLLGYLHFRGKNKSEIA